VLGEAPTVETEALDAVETSFGLERDLQAALRKNIEQLEEGLPLQTAEKKNRLRLVAWTLLRRISLAARL
jgi:hypothetical protein